MTAVAGRRTGPDRLMVGLIALRKIVSQMAWHLRTFWRPERANAPGHAVRQGSDRATLLVDAWSLEHGVQSGIQRVTGNFLSALQSTEPAAWTVHRTNLTVTGVATTDLARLNAGDCLFALDLGIDSLPRMANEIRRMRHRGAKLVVLVYDLLPMSHPGWFKLGFTLRFQRWARFVSREADQLICISQTTAAAVEHWLPGWAGSSDISVVSPGMASQPTMSAATAPRLVRPERFLLMVGTIEPRKGHAEILSAFERLWEQGCDAGLVIAGAPGWDTADLQQRLRGHPLRGDRLCWLEGADDATVAALYASCLGVLLASRAEGYGLPISEARTWHKPILARRIPSFEEQDDTDIDFFAVDASVEDLALAIDAFLRDTPCAGSPAWRDRTSEATWTARATEIWDILSKSVGSAGPFH